MPGIARLTKDERWGVRHMHNGMDLKLATETGDLLGSLSAGGAKIIGHQVGGSCGCKVGA